MLTAAGRDPMAAVFTCQAGPAPEAIAEEAIRLFSGHPRCARDTGLARRDTSAGCSRCPSRR
jgi:hypothetical protein